MLQYLSLLLLRPSERSQYFAQKGGTSWIAPLGLVIFIGILSTIIGLS